MANARTIPGVHLWLLLMKAFHSVEAYSAATMPGGVRGESDFRILEVLLHKGPLPVNTIGPKVFLTPGSISTAVERLYRRALVTRLESKTDRRVRVVDLTAKGRRLIESQFASHAAALERLAEVLSPAERLQLSEALKKLGKRAADSIPQQFS